MTAESSVGPVLESPPAGASRFSPSMNAFVIGGTVFSFQQPVSQLLPIVLDQVDNLRSLMYCSDYVGIPHALLYDLALVRIPALLTEAVIF